MIHVFFSKLGYHSDNGLSPVWHQAIIGIDAVVVLIGPLQTNSIEILGQNKTILIQQNEYENVVCKVAAILSRPHCVNP